LVRSRRRFAILRLRVKKLRVKLVVLVAVLAAGALTIHYSTREPSADGRTLSEWLDLWINHQTGPVATDVTNAVRKIGVKGIPALLDRLEARDPAWRVWLEEKWPASFRKSRWPHSPDAENIKAEVGFAILGPQAAPAIPELAKMLLDTNRTDRCAEARGRIGSAAIPVLRAALTNQDQLIGARAALGLSTTPEGRQRLVPWLRARRDDTNQSFTTTALVWSARNLPPEEMVPLLTEYAGDPRWEGSPAVLFPLIYVRSPVPGAAALLAPYLTNANPTHRHATASILRQWGVSSEEALRMASNSPSMAPLRN
jgi:hypothetical protein